MKQNYTEQEKDQIRAMAKGFIQPDMMPVAKHLANFQDIAEVNLQKIEVDIQELNEKIAELTNQHQQLQNVIKEYKLAIEMLERTKDMKAFL